MNPHKVEPSGPGGVCFRLAGCDRRGLGFQNTEPKQLSSNPHARNATMQIAACSPSSRHVNECAEASASAMS